MMRRSKAQLLSSVSLLSTVMLVTQGGMAQDAPTVPEAPEIVIPFDLVATSLGNAEGVPIGGNNAILRFNGLTGATLTPLLVPADDPLFNDPRDIVLDGAFGDPTATFLIHTGQFPASSPTGFINDPDFDNILRIGLDGSVIEVVGDFSAATTLTPVGLADGTTGPLVDAGGGVFGPGGNFFSGSRTTGEIVETNPLTGEVLGPIDADFSAVDFPRGFVFDAAGNLYLGNGSNPATGEGSDQILFFANNGDGTFADPVEFAAPDGFSPLDVILSPDGTQLVVSSEFPFVGGAAPMPGQIFVFDIDSAAPGTAAGFTTFNPTGADGNSLIVAPRGLGFGPDGLLYSSSTGSDQIFRFNFATGALVDDGAFAETPDLFGQAVNFLSLFGDCDADGCGRYLDADGFTGVVSDTFTVAEGGLVTAPLSLFGATANIIIDGQLQSTTDAAVALSAFDAASTTVNGLIEVTGDSSIGVFSTGGDITVSEDAFITVEGDLGIGIFNFGVDADIDVAGTIITSGSGSAALLDGADGTIVTVTETGGLFTTGDSSNALLSVGNGSTISLAGTVASEGVFSDAVNVAASDVTITATGLVSTIGDFSSAVALGADASLSNSGALVTSGDTASVVRLSGDAVAVNTADGSIAASGAGSAGVLIAGDGSFTNAGSVSATGGGTSAPLPLVFDPLASPSLDIENIPAAGVILGNAGATVTNSGTITSATGPAVYSSSDLAAFQNGGSIEGLAANTIVNLEGGSLSGAVAILGGDLSENVSNFGTITGNISLGGGDDSLVLDFITGSLDGAIDGGAGIDTLTLAGSATLGTIAGFETIGGAALTDLTVTESLTATSISLADNATFTLAEGATGTGGLAIDGISTIDGAVSSIPDLVPALVLSGGSLTVSETGSVAANGEGASGILVTGADSSLTVAGSVSSVGSITSVAAGTDIGPITTLEADTILAAGITIATSGTSTTVTGSVTSPNSAGIYFSSDLAASNGVTSGSNSLTIAEGGSVSGSVGIIAGDLVENITINGSLSDGIFLGGGDDSLTIDVGASVTGGLDGGAGGGDSLTFTGGSGDVLISTATGFEVLTLTGGGSLSLAGSVIDGLSVAIVNAGTFVDLTGTSIGSTNGLDIAVGSTVNSDDAITTGVINNGTLQIAGESIGTLAISGGLLQGSTGSLDIQLDNISNDLVTVTAPSQLAGSIDLSILPDTNVGALAGSRLIVAGIVDGSVLPSTAEFLTANGAFTLFATPFADASGLNVSLTTFADISDGLDLFFNDGILGDALSDVFNVSPFGGDARTRIFDLVEEGVPGIRSASPEFYDGFIQAAINIGDRFMDQVHERLALAPQSGSGGWTSFRFEAFDRDIDDGFSFDFDQINFAFGYDYDLGPVVVGVAGNYANADVDVELSGIDGLLGSGDTEVFGITAYAGTRNVTGFNATASVGYQFVDINASRTIAGDASIGPILGDYDPGQLIAEIRGSYTAALTENIFLRPRIGLDFVVSNSETFEETGDPVFALNVAAQSYEEIGGTAGLDLFANIGVIQPFVGGFVRLNFQDDGREFAAVLQGLPSSLFVIDGVVDDTEYGADVGLRGFLFDGAAIVSVGYEGRFSENNESHQLDARLVIPF